MPHTVRVVRRAWFVWRGLRPPLGGLVLWPPMRKRASASRVPMGNSLDLELTGRGLFVALRVVECRVLEEIGYASLHDFRHGPADVRNARRCRVSEPNGHAAG